MAGKSYTWFDHLIHTYFRRVVQNPKRILRSYLRTGMTILDVGCGTGYFTVPMARMVGTSGRVIAVDLDAERLKELGRTAIRKGLQERIDLRHASGDSLGIESLAGQIDFALAFYMVHHAPDAARLMREVLAGLKAGGKFLIVEPGHHASVETCDFVESTARQVGFTIDSHPRVRRDWSVLLTKDQ
jgi:ubiquinone/menaquinone biosynthesis C-methylase UbiE